jgi:hypothetical protein
LWSSNESGADAANAFTAVVVDFVDVYEFIEWHGV